MRSESFTPVWRNCFSGCSSSSPLRPHDYGNACRQRVFNSPRPDRWRVSPFSTTSLIYAQLALGATMRHQHRDLSILDFPAAYGQVIPVLSDAKLAEINTWRNARAFSEVTRYQIWLQMTHRFLALAIAVGVVACFRARAGELRVTPLLWFATAGSCCSPVKSPWAPG